MSEDYQRGTRELPPPSWPSTGQRTVPDQSLYMPGQQRNFPQHQLNTNPQYFHPTTQPNPPNLCPVTPPTFPGHDSFPRGSLQHLPRPPPVDHHSLQSLPTPSHLSNPPPMFSRPPPNLPPSRPPPNPPPHLAPPQPPPNLPPHLAPPRPPPNPPPHLAPTQPPPNPPPHLAPTRPHPPAIPHIPNIPHNAFHNPNATPPQEVGFSWQLGNPPAADPCHQMQANTGFASSTHVPIVPINEETAAWDSKRQRDERDSNWLKEFERRVKSCPPSPPAESTKGRTAAAAAPWKNVKLAEVQRLVLESHSLMKHLSLLEEQLSQVSSSADEKEWNHLVQQAEDIKVRLTQALEKLQDRGFIEHTKLLLKQRRAKRKRVKRRKEEKKLEKEELKRKREEEEALIDAWQAKLQREEESKRREEAVKREADSVLGEVRQKQSEGHRMAQLLEALATLRATRATQAVAQGRPKDPEAEQRFTATTEMIAKILKKQQQEYELEEQTLRVMMEESATHRSAALSAKRDSNFARYGDSIRKLLFGPTATSDSPEGASKSLETLIQRRWEWDQFLVDGCSPLASAVPLSWVLPPTQPEPAWAAFLKQ